MKGGGRVLGEGRSVGSEEGALPCACSTEWMAPSADGARCQDLQLLNVKCKSHPDHDDDRAFLAAVACACACTRSTDTPPTLPLPPWTAQTAWYRGFILQPHDTYVHVSVDTLHVQSDLSLFLAEDLDIYTHPHAHTQLPLPLDSTPAALRLSTLPRPARGHTQDMPKRSIRASAELSPIPVHDADRWPLAKGGFGLLRSRRPKPMGVSPPIA